MLSMTRNFLVKTHEAFDELGYHPKSGNFSFDELQLAAINTINHSKELEDGINGARMYQFIVKNYSKIVDKVTKYYDFWSSLKWEGNELISLCSDEEAIGTYFITNALDTEYKSVFILGHSLGDDCVYSCKCKNGKFSVDKDPDYYLRFSKMSSTKMVLLDKNENKLCVIVLSDSYNVFLENNKTDYEIVLYESCMAIYKKSYIDSLHGAEPDANKILCTIEWDILDEKSEFGFARLVYFEAEGDLEMFVMFAMSCFLLFRQFIHGSNATTFATIAATSIWARRIK